MGTATLTGIQLIELSLVTQELIIKRHIRSTFNLPRHEKVSVSVTPIGAGRVELNSLTIENQYNGDYFPGVPVSISAIPRPDISLKNGRKFQTHYLQ